MILSYYYRLHNYKGGNLPAALQKPSRYKWIQWKTSALPSRLENHALAFPMVVAERVLSVLSSHEMNE